MTRHLFFAVCLILSLPPSLYSQREKALHFGVHLTPGYQIFQWDDPSMISTENTFNFTGGLAIYYDLGARFQLQSGIHYQSAKLSLLDYSASTGCDLINNRFEPNNSWYDDRLRVHYLALPLAIKVKINDAINHFYLKPGLNLAFKMAHKSQSFLVECGESETSIPLRNTYNEPNPWLINGNFGVGYEFSIAPKIKAFIEPQVQYSFSKIFDETGIVNPLKNNAKLLQVGLQIGLRF